MRPILVLSMALGLAGLAGCKASISASSEGARGAEPATASAAPAAPELVAARARLVAVLNAGVVVHCRAVAPVGDAQARVCADAEATRTAPGAP